MRRNTLKVHKEIGVCMIKEIDGLHIERTISADMILLVQGFEQSHLLLDNQVTTFHIYFWTDIFEKEDVKSFQAVVDDAIIYEMVICCILWLYIS